MGHIETFPASDIVGDQSVDMGLVHDILRRYFRRRYTVINLNQFDIYFVMTDTTIGERFTKWAIMCKDRGEEESMNGTTTYL